MSDKTVFGETVCQWFEALLRQTMSQEEDFDRHYQFLVKKYVILLEGLKDLLANNWPGARKDPSAAQRITLGPVKRGKTAWQKFGIHWISGALKFPEKMARLQNELLALSVKSPSIEPWKPKYGGLERRGRTDSSTQIGGRAWLGGFHLRKRKKQLIIIIIRIGHRKENCFSLE